MPDVGTIVVVLMCIFLVAMSLERMSGPLIDATKATVAAATFFAVIDALRPERGSVRPPEVSADGGIVFERVTFAYPGRPKTKVLDDLSLRIRAGQVTAIVGPSGSGKSTIVGLIEQWYTLHSQAVIEEAITKTTKRKDTNKDEHTGMTEDTHRKPPFWARLKAQRQAKKLAKDRGEPTSDKSPAEKACGERIQLSGRIMTSGHNLDEIEVKWWRSQIGLVQQEPFLFNDSIYANVMHGMVGTRWEDEPLEVKQELVRQACREALADEFIDRLPEGYNTQVGDSGLKLSGGQRQRILIARSIVKKPSILILDEATSAIDVRSEKIIQAALDRVSRGRTTIVIAHRLSTIAKADKILVLQNGRLMEQGTHASLLSDEAGVYAGLVRVQMLALGTGEREETGYTVGDALGEKEEEPQALTPSPGRSTSQALMGEEETEKVWENRGIVGSFGRLLYEQRSRFPFYIVTVLCAAGIASGLPLQAYLFAQVINVFTLPQDRFLGRAAFWSLMWFVLALAIGFFYIVSGVITVSLEHFICAVYREQYFSSLIR